MNEHVRICLLGRGDATGLGYQNSEIAKNLPGVQWLVSRQADRRSARRTRPIVIPSLTTLRFEALIHRFDWILFAERPDSVSLIRRASQAGVKVACIPNWEHLSPTLPWLRYVDLMICPTKATYALVSDWVARYAMALQAIYVPWPIDVRNRQFRVRKNCARFLFVNGWGGCRARRLDGTKIEYGRKGLSLIISVAAIARHLRFIIYSQSNIGVALPGNIELRLADDNQSLYDIGDVCVQPSHWEGIGLQLLECQAAGMPLITTDAPPMNEYRPLATLPVAGIEVVRLTSQPFLSNLINPMDVASVLTRFHERPISDASYEARRFVETQHSWSKASSTIAQTLRDWPGKRNGESALGNGT